MIYTITFSPSIDYVINTNNKFIVDDLNRVEDYQLVPGGKGINASIVLKRIGFENKAITFLGQPTKSLFLDLLNEEKVEMISFQSQNATRINVKMFANDTNFEINGARAKINPTEYNELLDFIEKKLNSDDFVFIMGICEEEMLAQLIKKLNQKSIEFALDIDSKQVLNFLKYEPFILKPNKNELESLLDVKIKSIDDIKNSMIKLKNEGLKNVLVSDGKNGSYFLSQDNKFFKISLLKTFDIVSTVGAGDTLISSFVSLYKKTNDIIYSLKHATSLSIGTSCTKFLANKEDFEKYIDYIEVKELN